MKTQKGAYQTTRPLFPLLLLRRVNGLHELVKLRFQLEQLLKHGFHGSQLHFEVGELLFDFTGDQRERHENGASLVQLETSLLEPGVLLVELLHGLLYLI